ncbi:PREDICTED: uncharacterized protein C12orf50 homolog, partial [Buceros rhinoceros silvestris]|uniref:uncharacterized protein C12orf50 homolog n=1 Tax=Buceros rhinoceros silvestris TaxID=175836 RepID=UPI00052929BA
MNISGNDSHFRLYSPYAQERCSNTFCYWETQSAGCLRISCAFRHRKPRYINGLYLPSTNSPPRNQETISQPVYPSLVINLNDEEDEDDEESDEEEENYVSDWEPKNAAEVEELRAIKEICHKSGEYYGIQHLHEQQSTKTTSSPQENEPLPLKDTKKDFQKGDSNTIPTKFNDTGGEGESSERRESVPRTDRGSLENGVNMYYSNLSETNHTELVKNHHQKEVKKNYVSEEPKNPPNRVTGKETNHTELVKNHHQKEVKKNYVSEEPKNPPNRVTGKETNHTELVKNHHQKEVKKNYVSEEPKNPPNRVTGKDPKIKPGYQQRDRRKDEGTAYSTLYVKKGGRNTYFNSSEPRRTVYVFYRTVNVTQEPKFSGSTDKYTSASYNEPTWRKRNPHAKTFSKFKTTIQILALPMHAHCRKEKVLQGKDIVEHKHVDLQAGGLR